MRLSGCKVVWLWDYLVLKARDFRYCQCVVGIVLSRNGRDREILRTFWYDSQFFDRGTSRKALYVVQFRWADDDELLFLRNSEQKRKQRKSCVIWALPYLLLLSEQRGQNFPFFCHCDKSTRVKTTRGIFFILIYYYFSSYISSRYAHARSC